MLFASIEFIFIFLPLMVALFYLAKWFSYQFALALLAVGSFVFYGWWSPKHLPLLGLSIIVNFLASLYIQSEYASKTQLRTLCMWGTVTLNLALLFYYKYYYAVLSSICHLMGFATITQEIPLPLGISFFTFTQITYLADVYQRSSHERNLTHYSLFVSYFPHLMAGPFLNHKDMAPQFRQQANRFFDSQLFCLGLFIFFLGLTKKLILADSVAQVANTYFNQTIHHATPETMTAWQGALSYTLQLYFDFSGYSDMAIGISLLFGIRIPINFLSPFKSRSIIDFWRCWHISLSRIIQDYLFTPIVKYIVMPHLFRRNIKAITPIHIFIPTVITMTLCGAWHGANFTFLVFGLFHGLMIAVNHIWRGILKTTNMSRPLSFIYDATCWGTTFLAVVISFVIFRSDTVHIAGKSLVAMFSLSGSFHATRPTLLIIALLASSLILPNTQQITARFAPCLMASAQQKIAGDSFVHWKPNAKWGAITGTLALASTLWLILSEKSVVFLYFRF